jgi:hypothetical protein
MYWLNLTRNLKMYSVSKSMIDIAYMIIKSKTRIDTCSILMCNSVLRIQVQPEPNPVLPNWHINNLSFFQESDHRRPQCMKRDYSPSSTSFSSNLAEWTPSSLYCGLLIVSVFFFYLRHWSTSSLSSLSLKKKNFITSWGRDTKGTPLWALKEMFLRTTKRNT